MKMKYSALAAAIALASVAGGANAAITAGTTDATASIFLTVWDPTVSNEASFNYNTGLNFGNFDGNASYSVSNLFANSVFATYFDSGNFATQNAWKWNVTGGLASSIHSKVAFTSATDQTSAMTNSVVSGAATKVNGYVANLGGCDSCGTNLPGTGAYAGTNYGTDLNGYKIILESDSEGGPSDASFSAESVYRAS